MKAYSIFDKAAVGAPRRTAEGYLVADCRIARAENIQVYRGAEVGRPDMATVRVYRPEAAVFDQKAMASFAFKPVTDDHPTSGGGLVSADTWKDVAVGITGGEIARDGEFLRIPMVLMDRATIDKVESGKCELSAGYQVALDWTPGRSARGEEYDARVDRVVGNHLAVVEKGRAGSECRIGDSGMLEVALDTASLVAGLAAIAPRLQEPIPSTATGDRAMPDVTRTVVMDGISVEVTPQGQEALNRLIAARDSAHAGVVAGLNARLTDAEQKLRTELSAKDGQIAAMTQAHAQAVQEKDGALAGMKAAHDAALSEKDKQIADLTAQLSDEALQARAEQRAAMVGDARLILGDSYDPRGKTDAVIRREVVTKALGASIPDLATKDQSFFDGAYPAVVAMRRPAPGPGQDPVALQLAAAAPRAAGQPAPVLGDATGGPQAQPSTWRQNVDRIANAWKDGGGGQAA